MIDKEELDQLRSIDLLTYFINYEPEELIRHGKNGFKTKTHSSLYLSNGLWCYFARGIGGRSALDYLIFVKKLSFIEAVEHLRRCTKGVIPKNIIVKKEENYVFQLPKKNNDNLILIHYLCHVRCIDREIVDMCINKNLIYESAYDHSVIFVGYDENNCPRYAFSRSTTSALKKDIAKSCKQYSFSITYKSEHLHVFESAIDLLSYMTICKLQNQSIEDHYLSLSGVNNYSTPALDYYLYRHPQIKYIHLHLDNDEAGRMSTSCIIDKFSSLFYVVDCPIKNGKDVNEYLCAYKHKLND